MLSGTLNINNKEIEGESLVDKAVNEIDIFGVHWRVKQKDFAREGKGLTQGRGEVSSFTFFKNFDAASVYLALAAMQGKSFTTIIFTVRKASGEENLDYLVVTMTNCVISDFEMQNDGTDNSSSLIKEKVSIAFDKIKMLYTIQEEDGSAGAQPEFEYDIKAGTS